MLSLILWWVQLRHERKFKSNTKVWQKFRVSFHVLLPNIVCLQMEQVMLQTMFHISFHYIFKIFFIVYDAHEKNHLLILMFWRCWPRLTEVSSPQNENGHILVADGGAPLGPKLIYGQKTIFPKWQKETLRHPASSQITAHEANVSFTDKLSKIKWSIQQISFLIR